MDAGYNVETFGQKTFNGVALLSKTPLEDVTRGLPGFEDAQSRYIEGVVTDGAGAVFRVASIYLAQRQSSRQRQIPLQAAFHGRIDRPCEGAACAGGARGAGGRL